MLSHESIPAVGPQPHCWRIGICESRLKHEGRLRPEFDLKEEKSRAIPQAPLAALKAKRRLAVSQEPLGLGLDCPPNIRGNPVSRDVAADACGKLTARQPRVGEACPGSSEAFSAPGAGFPLGIRQRWGIDRARGRMRKSRPQLARNRRTARRAAADGPLDLLVDHANNGLKPGLRHILPHRWRLASRSGQTPRPGTNKSSWALGPAASPVGLTLPERMGGRRSRDAIIQAGWQSVGNFTRRPFSTGKRWSAWSDEIRSFPGTERRRSRTDRA
jgi:hypothetical protein